MLKLILHPQMLTKRNCRTKGDKPMGITDTTTMISLSIKRKICDKWEEVPLEEACKSVAHTELLLQSLDGTELWHS